MKNFIRILSVLMVLLVTLSTLMFSASAAEFRDYYEAPEFIYGDVDFDGKVSVKDATALQKYLAKLIELSENAVYFGDVNNSNDISISDATLIQKYVANIIDIFPAEIVYDNYYECVADGTVTEVEYDVESSALIVLKVEKDGYYYISATPSKGGEIYFEITNDQMNGAWFSETDGESSFAFADMKAGVYEVFMYTMGDEDVVADFKAGISDFKPPFDKASADELEAGDRVDVKAGTGDLVYQVDMEKLNLTEDAYVIYTKGAKNNVSLKCYDSNYGLVGESIPDDNGDAWLYVFDDYLNPELYLVVSLKEGGDDFTLYCDTNLGMIMASADEATLDEVYEIEVKEYTEEIDGEVISYNMAEVVYKFTPDASGYYSFNFDYAGYISAMAVIVDFESPDSGYIMLKEKEDGSRLFDVLYLEAGCDYYMAAMISLNTSGTVDFCIKNSDEEEFNQAQQDNMFGDATNDQAEATEIFAGDTFTIDVKASDDEFITKDFVFTAPEDCTVVLYSEGSQDACVFVADENGITLHMGDDTPLLHSTLTDFAVIGTLKKGETVYFNVGTFSMISDSYSFKLVYESDYTPLT